MFWLQIFILLICLGLQLSLCLYFLALNFTSISFVPSSGKKLKRVFTKLEVGPNTKLIDLGSGHGVTLFTAADLGAEVTGIEINPFLTIFSKLRRAFRKDKNRIKIYNRNFYKIDLSQYNTVYAYLLPEIMQKLSDKLYTELKPGSRIISSAFQIAGKQPAQILEKNVFVYIV